jgi:hypothetical protein
MLGVQLLHAFPRDMRINLCRGDIRVTKQHLHHTQIGTVIQQMGRERVPQGMR